MRGNERTVGERNTLKDWCREYGPPHRHVRLVRQEKHLIILIYRTGPADEWVDRGFGMLAMAVGARCMDMYGANCFDLPIRDADIGPDGSHKPNADQQIGQQRQPQANPSGTLSHMSKGECVGHMLGVGHHAGSRSIPTQDTTRGSGTSDNCIQFIIIK